MMPSKLDITIWRGLTFELELISQVKVYVFDPAIHNGPADLKRTHAENLEHYGFVYEYVDFATLYTDAVLTIIKPWVKAGQTTKTPLLTLTLTDNDIELTASSVKIGITAADTADIAFDSGTYELLLTSTNGKIDGLVYGTVTVLGDK